MNLSPLSAKNFLIASLVLAAAILSFLALTLRAGHGWDGDYALNVMQAGNIVSGESYVDTYFIPNSDNAIHPALYPPGLPLLIAPFYGQNGQDLESMKWIGLIALTLWVLVFALIARRYLSPWLALVVTGLFAIHPYIWEIKDTVYAELPFLLFCYTSLLLAEKLIDSNVAARRDYLLVVGVAAAIVFTYLTRTVAIVLFPVIFSFSLYRTSRFLTTTNAALVAALVIIFVVLRIYPSDTGTYAGYFDNFSLRGVVYAFRDYGLAVGTLLQVQGDGITALDWMAILLFLGLVAAGFISRLLDRPGLLEVFLVAYVALLLVFPIRWEFDRYSMPVWPLLLVYCLVGAQALASRIVSVRWRPLLPAILVVALLGSFGAVYSTTSFKPLEFSVTDARAQQLFEAIRTDVPKDAIVLARKPTIIGLFTHRHATIWPRRFTDDEFWAYANKVNATFLVRDIYQFASGPFKSDDPLDVFVRTNPGSVRLLFRNDWFDLYELVRPSRIAHVPATPSDRATGGL